MPVHYRACNLCEAICGLVVTHQDGVVQTITGDKDDPFSRGHICPKALALKDVYEDPNRLRRPMKRTAAGWETIGWAQAFREVGERLRQLRDEQGGDAIGFYAGNPSVHNAGTFLAAPGLIKAIGTRHVFSATSVDQLPHHVAAWQLFGHPLLLPVPDLDRTDFWLIIGGNPIASNGSIMTAPDVANRLKAIQQRGGRVVVIDPRRTETADRADAHYFIRPGTDVLLLLAMVQTLFAENRVRPGALAGQLRGLDDLRAAVADFTPERVSTATGMDPAVMRELARTLATTDRAACYGRVGVSVQAFGGLCLWLINVLNLLTGHLDSVGGMQFTTPAIDPLPGFDPARPYARYDRYRSRVSGRSEFMGELPVACLAEDILTPADPMADPATDPGRLRTPIRALITSCGNPVLSTPNGRQLDTALASLELLVSVDIYLNETTRHAHYILPPTTGLETAHYDLTFHLLAIRNTARYAEPMLPPDPDARADWQIFDALRHALDPSGAGPATSLPAFLDRGLRYGPYGQPTPDRPGLSLDLLRAHPHGLDLGPLTPRLPQRLLTPDQTIHLAPAFYLADLDRASQLLRIPEQLAPAGNTFQLISRRHLRDNNSWLHNAHRLVKGPNRCTLDLCAADADKLGIQTGQAVRVRSRVGVVELPARVTDSMMPGVVSMPHGYGHNRPGTRLDVAARVAGVSINDLTDDQQLDELTGNAALTGVLVTIDVC